MRKLLLAVATLMLTMGLTNAAVVRLVKYDEKTKEVTVKEGKKGEEVEKTYKITDKTKFIDGDKDITIEEGVKKLTGEKPVKGFDITVDDKNAKEIKFLAKKKKSDK